MSDNLAMNVPENWKENIRDCFLSTFLGTPEEIQKANADLDYAYHYYAPARLYKFFGPDLERFESVKNNKFWYSAPSRFNDPYDSDFPVNQDLFFNSLVRQKTQEKGIRVGSTAWKEMQAETPKITKQVRQYLDEIRRTTAITCFTEDDDSQLMWTHYAYDHRGISVAYDLIKIYSELKICPVPVIYSKDRVCLTSIDLNDVETSSLSFLAGSLTSKSPEWSYETEWRLIQNESLYGSDWDAKKGGGLLPGVKPAAITFGCAVDRNGEFAQAVEAYCRENSVDLYKMEKHPTEYRLIKTPVLTFEAQEHVCVLPPAVLV